MLFILAEKVPFYEAQIMIFILERTGDKEQERGDTERGRGSL